MSPSNEFRPEPQDGFTNVDREVYNPEWNTYDEVEEPTELDPSGGCDDSAYWSDDSETDTDPVDLYGADYGDDQPEWMQ